MSFVTGDRSKLDHLIGRLQAPGRFRQGMADASRPIVQHLVESCFRSAKDPYEEPWPPLKKPTGRLPLAGLNSDFRYEASDAEGVTVQTDKDYARYHQEGTAAFPARRYLPDSRGLPPRWKALLFMALSRYVRQQLTGHG